MKKLFLILLIVGCLAKTGYARNYPFENLGLSCWMNAALQCLFKAKPLSDIVMNEDPTKETDEVIKSFIQLYQAVNSKDPKLKPEKQDEIFSNDQYEKKVHNNDNDSINSLHQNFRNALAQKYPQALQLNERHNLYDLFNAWKALK